ncbi:MAG: efflux RND transporter periplasmic adaptor subunit [Hyphomicrobiaceae bacterium]
MKRKFIVALAALTAVGFGLYVSGIMPLDGSRAPAALKTDARKPKGDPALAPAVTVSKVAIAAFNETVVITGTLVAREEILVATEVEGLRVIELLVDEGDRVKKGQVLARLVSESLDAQLAQNDANLARNTAALAQARSSIVQAEARVVEARNAFERAVPLKNSGYLSGSTYDQRESAKRTADAQLISTKDGLALAEAERKQIEAQRREIAWKRANTEVKSPADGVVSRRNARVGAVAAAAGEAMFRIIARGEIELDAEVPEAQLAKIKDGQAARVTVAGVEEAPGTVRLISPEIDKATRLGRARIFLGDNRALRIGAFGRGIIETAKSRGLGVPVSAVVYNGETTTVQVVVNSVVETRRIKPGLTANGMVELREGVAEGDLVVTRAGTFLRNGDTVRPILPEANKLSDIR